VRILLGVVAALALTGCKRERPVEVPAQATLVVAATGDTWGEVEPCG
jgi:hypothetical protein